MQDPDHELIREAKGGNQAAFGKLVNQYYQMVYSISYGVLNHSEAARDVAQEVFFKVFREIRNFAEKSKFKTWLYRIAVNAAIDEGRKKRPVVSLDAGDDPEDEKPAITPADHAPGPRDLAYQSELREVIGRAIEELSADHRAVLVLREFQDLSYEEIAGMLHIEIGTVMSRLFYARKKLAEILSLRMGEAKPQ